MSASSAPLCWYSCTEAGTLPAHLLETISKKVKLRFEIRSDGMYTEQTDLGDLEWKRYGRYVLLKFLCFVF
jgi:hypothetical protein